MKLLFLLASASFVPYTYSLCFIQGCDKWWNGGAKNDRKITGACAVLFDENCCKSSKTFHVVQRGEEGKLCGLVSRLNPLSSCQGPKLKDAVDRYKRNKLVFSAYHTAHMVEELNDDFNDMNEDIESYRCKCS